MKRAFKISTLFVGTVIGAGFATGREISLFFGELSPIVAAASGIVLGGLCALFLICGKYRLVWKSKFYSAIIFLCAIITFSAMLAASEKILFEMTNIRFMGLVSGVLGIIIVVLGIDKIKILNAIIVPLIIAFIIILFIKNANFEISGGVSVFRPVAYGALNIFLAGELMAKEGEKASKRDIVLSSVLTGVFLSIMLFAIQSTIHNNTSSMPMLDIADKLNLTLTSQLLVYFAVFTTLLSSAEIMVSLIHDYIANSSVLSSPKIYPALSGRIVPALFALLLSYAFSLLGFDNIVDWFYPLISACGLISVGAVIIKFIIYRYEKRGREPSN